MKTIRNIFFLLCFTGLFVTSCTEELEAPDPCLIAPETAKVYEPVLFELCSDANYHVIWTGDPEHNYELRDEVGFDRRGRPVFQTGFPVKDNLFQYTYRTAGTFKVVLVQTNSAYDGIDYKQALYETTIVVEE